MKSLQISLCHCEHSSCQQCDLEAESTVSFTSQQQGALIIIFTLVFSAWQETLLSPLHFPNKQKRAWFRITRGFYPKSVKSVNLHINKHIHAPSLPPSSWSANGKRRKARVTAYQFWRWSGSQLKAAFKSQRKLCVTDKWPCVTIRVRTDVLLQTWTCRATKAIKTSPLFRWQAKKTSAESLSRCIQHNLFCSWTEETFAITTNNK